MKTYVKIARGSSSIIGFMHGDLAAQNPFIEKILVYIPNRMEPLKVKRCDLVKTFPSSEVRFQLDLFYRYLEDKTP